MSTPSSFGFGIGSFVDDSPLVDSIYDDPLDPWSAAPSPAATPAPRNSLSVFNSAIADAKVPSIYNIAFSMVDPHNTGTTSVNALSRLLATSSLSAGTIDKIINLVSSRPRVSKLEFFVALALVALAQSGKDVNMEQVAALSTQNTLPEPVLDLSRVPPLISLFNPPVSYRPPLVPSVRSSYSIYSTSENPWKNSSQRFNTRPGNFFDVSRVGSGIGSCSGTGMPKDWWKKQEVVRVNLLGPQGFILNRYMVYEIVTDRGPPVSRRYSEFVFLWDCLTRRYPFRLIPLLPPKRIGPDEHFLEQRRKGLTRALNFVINHPIIKIDGLLSVFLTEPSFETWRKQTDISLEEESVSKRVDRVEEMSIPSDLEDKIATLREKLGPLIKQWQWICILVERIIRRREAAASELSRLTNAMRVLVEINDKCWRGDDCDLSSGVRSGLEMVAEHAQRHSEMSDLRTRTLFDTTLEAIKAQRDLYLATRDLLIRHERLSIDQVERLKKRIESISLKLDGVRATQKDGSGVEVERLVTMLENDQTTLATQLSRRIFIQASMWHELRVVLHNRENALLTKIAQSFVLEELAFTERVGKNWHILGENLERMPYE